MKKVLITGISGFAGSHLAEFLLSQQNFNVAGTYLLEESLGSINGIKNKLKLLKVDLTKSKSVTNIVDATKPDFIFHLAALTSPADSFRSPLATIENNIAAEMNLLSAVLYSKLFNTRVLIISSGEIYGLVKKKDLPIDEETQLMPTSPYAVSKIAQDYLGLQYFLSYNLKTIRVRPFNHIGPRQSPRFVVADFAKKIAEIENIKGKEPVIFVGNLDAKRDFTDVRDIVRAYVLAVENGKPGEVYNIGSEESYKISDILNKLLSLSKIKIRVRVDKSKLRPIDIPELLCESSKFRKLTNWKPQIPIEKTLKDTLDYWRKII